MRKNACFLNKNIIFLTFFVFFALFSIFSKKGDCAMSEIMAFGKSKAELGSILDSISSHTDKNHPSSDEKNNPLEFLAEGMKQLANDSGARKTFGVEL